MAIQNINLWKLLKLLYLPENKLISEFRSDIRNDIKKLNNLNTNGGDFHAPFWRDAKDHVSNLENLASKTKIRIATSRQRRRLYPLLHTGFIKWWDEKRRWRNEKHEVIPNSIKGKFQVPNLNAIIKIENIMALKIGDDTNKLIYPYFSEEPSLSEEAARIGLWLMSQTLEKHRIEDMRILDILRAQPFSVSDHPLQGNEENIFNNNYGRILDKWARLRTEYK